MAALKNIPRKVQAVANQLARRATQTKSVPRPNSSTAVIIAAGNLVSKASAHPGGAGFRASQNLLRGTTSQATRATHRAATRPPKTKGK